MKPCKFLDYTTKYFNCKLIDLSKQFPDCKPFLKYWKRLSAEKLNLPVNVQFCKKKGRINEMFACYNYGEKDCYTPE